MVARIDFTGLIPDHHLGGYRNNAQRQIVPWLSTPLASDTEATKMAYVRAREAVERHRGGIEDLLVAIQGIEALNRQIKEVLDNGWPQWAQGIVTPEAATRVRRLLGRLRAARNELEDVVIWLSEGMNSEAEHPPAPPHSEGDVPALKKVSAGRGQSTQGRAGDLPAPKSTRAIVHINGFDKHGAFQSAQLKRLALFFDEIRYVLPDFWIIKDEVLDDSERVFRHDNGLIEVIGGIDPVRDTRPAIPLPFDSLADQLQHTLSALVDHGIAQEYDTYPLKAGGEDHFFDRVKHRLAWDDASDPVFARLSRTTAADFRTEYIPLTIHFHGDSPFGQSPNGEHSLNIYAVIPPSALLDSVDITTVLYVAQSTSSFPVFLEAHHRAEIAHRYQRYQAGLHVLEDSAPGSVFPADFRTRFGEVAFTLANGVASSDLIAEKSVEDILRYRRSMDDARRRFISEHLMEATDLVQDNPWGPQTRDELEKFVRGKLTSEVLRYQEASKVGWERLFGTATVSFAEVSRTALLGGGAGAVGQFGDVIGSLLPNVAPWDMALIGALAGAAHQAPGLVKAIVDTILKRQQARRSSIAYVAEFR